MNKIKKTYIYSFIFGLVFSLSGLSLLVPQEAQAARNITFPVIGKSSFSNDFDAPRYLRGEHRKHNATDIIANKGQKLVAAVSGTIIDVQYPQPDWGYSVSIRDYDGYVYTYIHLNDDNSGTNDGNGGGMKAYTADIREGNKVARGQHIGWVGDSGFSNGIPHLHFEMYLPNGKVVNPYYSLREAKRISRPIVNYPTQYKENLPHGPTFRGGVNVAKGNLDADGQQEYISGVASNGASVVRVYNHNTQLSGTFNAYGSSFRGGIDVALGDIDGDGIDEIITVPMKNGSPLVRVFNLDGEVLDSFYAYPVGFKHGVRISAGDTDGDGEDEIITGPNKNGGPHVKIFEPDGTMNTEFFAYNTLFRGGIDVATGDIDGDNVHEVITSPSSSGGPHIKVWEPNGAMKTEFYAYNEQFRGGVRVSAGNAFGHTNDVIATVPDTSGGPSFKLFRGTGSGIFSQHFLEPFWIGSYDVSIGGEDAKIGTGYNRRTSIKNLNP